MKVYLYISDNNKTVHLSIKKRSYQLLCNDKKKINKHRIAKKISDVFIIAPEPFKKNRCSNCEKKVKKMIREQVKKLESETVN
ncbi:MAG: hypothetical protein GTN97_03520 [Nitrosopumilaceae archaeon]|nr:hypothetical protein [Nitrosopumilaceae archaeon]